MPGHPHEDPGPAGIPARRVNLLAGVHEVDLPKLAGRGLDPDGDIFGPRGCLFAAPRAAPASRRRTWPRSGVPRPGADGRWTLARCRQRRAWRCVRSNTPLSTASAEAPSAAGPTTAPQGPATRRDSPPAGHLRGAAAYGAAWCFGSIRGPRDVPRRRPSRCRRTISCRSCKFLGGLMGTSGRRMPRLPAAWISSAAPR